MLSVDHNKGFIYQVGYANFALSLLAGEHFFDFVVIKIVISQLPLSLVDFGIMQNVHLFLVKFQTDLDALLFGL